MAVGGQLASLLATGTFVVTGEVVPPRSGSGAAATEQARGLVGYVDAANVTDNPTSKAHMSSVAGASFVSAAGVEPTVQLTCRDRNRLAIEADLLGAWSVGARNVLALSGDPMVLSDEPEAPVVGDLAVDDLIRLIRRLREDGTLLSGAEVEDPPRFLVGAAEMPLADPYDPARLDAKLDAGADVIWTQIAYDVEALSAWADGARSRGVFERARPIVGMVPLRSAKAARFMDETLPGVRVPPSMIGALEDAGDDAARVGVELTVDVVKAIREIDGVAGVHLMGMGREDLVREVVERTGLFPRPVL